MLMLVVADFLITEVQAVRMLAINNPAALRPVLTTPGEVTDQVSELHLLVWL